MLTIQRCSLETMQSIYENQMQSDFPAAEIKPFSKIARLYQEGLYCAYGLYDDTDLVGYAFFCTAPGAKYMLLDYLAVSAQCRNKGYGGQFLTLLQNELAAYDYILLEADNDAFADTPAEAEIRRRRLGFYQRTGATLTAVRNVIFGCPFKVLYFPIKATADNNTVLSALQNIYTVLLTPEQFRQNAEFSLGE